MNQSKKRIALALFCGVIATATMAWYVSSVRAEATQSRQQQLSAYGGQQVEIYVATRDIAVGETLSSSNVSSQLWLSDLLPAGALSEQRDVFGKTVSMPLFKNEPVVAAKLGEIKIPVSVPAGLCAVSIPSEDVLAVGGVITAGNYVTIYAADSKTVELIAEDVLVLETSNGAYVASGSGSGVLGSASSRPKLLWVTLAVDPEIAQELIAASTTRKLHLVLPGGAIDGR
jgi:pilus assembly protein CpaB